MSAKDQITAWLEGIGLAQYARVFAENAIDLDILPDLIVAFSEPVYGLAAYQWGSAPKAKEWPSLSRYPSGTALSLAAAGGRGPHRKCRSADGKISCSVSGRTSARTALSSSPPE